MKIKKGKFFISPSDLNNFVACKYTALNEIKYHNKEIKKNEDKANDKLWKEMGISSWSIVMFIPKILRSRMQELNIFITDR